MALTFGGKRKPGGMGPRTPLDPLEQQLTDRIAAVLRALRNSTDVDAYVHAIQALDPDALERLLARVEMGALGARIEETLRNVVITGGSAEGQRIIRETPRVPSPFEALQYPGRVLPSGIIVPPGLAAPPDVEFTVATQRPDLFEYVDRRATEYARTRAANLVVQVDSANRLAIRRVIHESFTQPATADQTARKLRSMVGLHTRWARAVLNFDDVNYRRFLKDGMTQEAARARADVLTKRYSDRLIRRRAEMIARTEIQQAQNWGRQAAWDGGSKAGYVDMASQKEWRTAPMGSQYGPPCPICTELRGTRVPYNGTFANGYEMPPAHPHCRCTAVLVPPTRGLTGQPSQDMDSWLEQLDELDAESIAEYDRTVAKHGDPSRPGYAQQHPSSRSSGASSTDADIVATVQTAALRGQPLDPSVIEDRLNSYGNPGADALAAIVKKQGWDAPSPSVDEETFRRLVDNPELTLVWRGGPVGLERGMIEGTPYIGGGVAGPGTYVSTSVRRAGMFAQGSLVPMLIPRDQIEGAPAGRMSHVYDPIRDHALRGQGIVASENQRADWIVYNTGMVIVGPPLTAQFGDVDVRGPFAPHLAPTLESYGVSKAVEWWALVDGVAVPLEVRDDRLIEPVAKHGDPSRPGYAQLHPTGRHSVTSQKDRVANALRTGEAMGLGWPCPPEIKAAFDQAVKDADIEYDMNPAGARMFRASHDALHDEARRFAIEAGMPGDDAPHGDMSSADIYADAIVTRARMVRRQRDAFEYDEVNDVDDDATAMVLDMREGASVLVAVREETALQIVADGRIKTQFEVGDSNGRLDPDQRAVQETAVFDHHPASPVRTVYGYVANEGMGVDPRTPGPAQYGDVRLEMVPSVRSRTSMTAGDTLGHNSTPIPMTGEIPDGDRGVHAAMGRVNIPGYSRDVNEELRYQSVDEWTQEQDNYFEAQIHADVTTSMIAKVHWPVRAYDDAGTVWGVRTLFEEAGIEFEEYDPDDYEY